MREPRSPQLRAVIDSSVTVPILTHEGIDNHWLVQLWKSGIIKPLVNAETMTELREPLLRHSPTPHPMRARQFVRRAMAHYEPWCETVELSVPENAPQCRDTSDQKFIDLAITGMAECLITRDEDQLSINPQTTFEILDDAQFRESRQSGQEMPEEPGTNRR